MTFFAILDGGIQLGIFGTMEENAGRENIMGLLFINACYREGSRTRKLAETVFKGGYHGANPYR